LSNVDYLIVTTNLYRKQTVFFFQLERRTEET